MWNSSSSKQLGWTQGNNNNRRIRSCPAVLMWPMRGRVFGPRKYQPSTKTLNTILERTDDMLPEVLNETMLQRGRPRWEMKAGRWRNHLRSTSMLRSFPFRCEMNTVIGLSVVYGATRTKFKRMLHETRWSSPRKGRWKKRCRYVVSSSFRTWLAKDFTIFILTHNSFAPQTLPQNQLGLEKSFGRWPDVCLYGNSRVGSSMSLRANARTQLPMILFNLYKFGGGVRMGSTFVYFLRRLHCYFMVISGLQCALTMSYWLLFIDVQ